MLGRCTKFTCRYNINNILILAFLYAPKVAEGENGEQIELISSIGITHLNLVSNVPTIVQEVLEILCNACAGYGNPEYVEIFNTWNDSIQEEYSSLAALACELLEEGPISLICKPEGAFYAYCNGSALIGNPIPDKVPLNGRELEGIREKVGNDTFTTDIDIAKFFLYAAEVVVTPGSGFESEPTDGTLRICFTVSQATLKEALSRIVNATNYVLNQ